jgi:hypothetical protein
MEKYKIFALLGIILLLFAGYSYYMIPEINMAPADSYLDTLSVADIIGVSSANFSAVQGLATLTISPNNYLVNATLDIITDDPAAQIDIFSDLPLNLLSGGIGNATYSIPVTNSPFSLDIIFTFQNTSISHQVTFTVSMTIKDSVVSNSTTVFANP